MRLKAFAAAGLAITLAAPVAAQQYQPWTPPGTGVGDITGGAVEDRSVEAVLDALADLIAAGRRDRAASPDFLADLDALVARYTNPWPRVIARTASPTATTPATRPGR